MRCDTAGKIRRLSPLCQRRRGQCGFRTAGTGVGGVFAEEGVRGGGFALRSLGISGGNSVCRRTAPDGFGVTQVKGHTSGGCWLRGDGKQVMTSLPPSEHRHNSCLLPLALGETIAPTVAKQQRGSKRTTGFLSFAHLPSLSPTSSAHGRLGDLPPARRPSRTDTSLTGIAPHLRGSAQEEREVICCRDNPGQPRLVFI